MDAETRSRIQGTIDAHEVVLFMKGTPAQPRCGFSATVVQILDSMGVAYASVDVLSDPAIRDGIKEFSDWPTIPQVYVKKEFLGGCDIVKEMFGSGELEEKLGVQVAEVAPPTITVTERAAKALAAAVTGPDEGVRFGIDAKFNYELSLGARSAKDIVVQSNGVSLLLDRASASRANGSTIDYVDTPEGAAFKIDNPNEPPKVRQLPPRTLADKLKAGEKLALYDVRTPTERQMASLPGSTLVDRDVQQAIMALPKDTPLVFFCHHGSRSLQAAEFFLSNGFKNVYNLSGGIDAWSVEVDPGVARY